jgi:hypothetical protein
MRIYSAQLAEYPQEDIAAAIGELMVTERREGETAMPALATVNKAVRDAALRRRCSEKHAENLRKQQDEARDREAHPKNYVSMGSIVGDFYKRKGMEPAPAKQPAKAFCEHCHGVQLSALRPEDLRALADVLERQARP